MDTVFMNSENSKTTDPLNYLNGLPDGSNSVSDIQDYFEYILKNHETVTDNPSIRIYVNKTVNRITCKIKTGYLFSNF